ncbi:hypothetical protein LCGC14_0435130 [marine sediment metagenome]|uniref:HNH nuclease domain-containing protein n=1 Tax=marine sediment metagenome TaxID=412755 RepID=A0A0F9V920_9ZZZZ
MKCKMNKCNNLATRRKLCEKHYMRWHRWGSPNITHRASTGSGYICKVYGYKIITINGHQVREHRYLMEQHLGRPLTDSEETHHINGNKIDNRIKNMKILTKSKHTSLHHTKGFIGKHSRECSKCRITKPYTQFFRDTTNIFKHKSYCKKCYKISRKHRTTS